MKTTHLPDEILLGPDGHLSDAALACVADGENDLVSPAAHAHLDACEGCAQRLGESALLSLAMTDALAARSALAHAGESVPAAVAPAVVAAVPVVAPDRVTPSRAVASSRRRPLPVAAIAVALAVAIATAWPTLAASVSGLGATITGAVATVPFLARLGLSLARAPWAEGPLMMTLRLASAVVLFGVGLQVARITTRSSSLQEGGV